MARRGPLSAAHKAAISAGLKRYWATHGSSGGARSSKQAAPVSYISGAAVRAKPGKSAKSSKPPVTAKIGVPKPVQHLETGATISREEAARRMFGTGGAAKRIAAGRKRRR